MFPYAAHCIIVIAVYFPKRESIAVGAAEVYTFTVLLCRDWMMMVMMQSNYERQRRHANYFALVNAARAGQMQCSFIRHFVQSQPKNSWPQESFWVTF